MQQTVFPYILISHDEILIMQLGLISKDKTYVSGNAPHNNIHSFCSEMSLDEIHEKLEAHKTKASDGFAIVQVKDSSYSANGNIGEIMRNVG